MTSKHQVLVLAHPVVDKVVYIHQYQDVRLAIDRQTENCRGDRAEGLNYISEIHTLHTNLPLYSWIIRAVNADMLQPSVSLQDYLCDLLEIFFEKLTHFVTCGEHQSTIFKVFISIIFTSFYVMIRFIKTGF